VLYLKPGLIWLPWHIVVQYSFEMHSSNCVANEPAAAAQRGYQAFVLTAAAWSAAVGVFWFVHRATAILALSAVGYAVLLSGITVWLLPIANLKETALTADAPAKTWPWRIAAVAFFFFVPLIGGFAWGACQEGFLSPV
jgi:hypothetical protein